MTGDSIITPPPATSVVIFGATGDLTHRKLIPALYNLAHDGYLPEGFSVTGAARSPLTDEQFRSGLYDAVKKFSRREVNDDLWKAFSQKIFYQSVNGKVPEDFVKLRERLDGIAAAQGQKMNHLYYLATSPDFFGDIAANLRRGGLVADPGDRNWKTALIVEKPFGHDVESAHKLNLVLRENFAEDQIYRIDHYLGKEIVQNILIFRFANGIFEPLWNHKYIDNIQIAVCERVGVENRAGYFDHTGILRDIVQNHVLQMLSLLCIEPPVSLSDASSIRDEKVKVLRAITRLTVDDVLHSTVRGQYVAGALDGEKVPGYLEEKGVKPNSKTDTYAAITLGIDNWRWAGVPIYIRAGKRMPKRITEITVYFRKPPASLFAGKNMPDLEPNVLSIQVQPEEGISLRIYSKPPGHGIAVRPVEMDFNYGASFDMPSPDAYERLLLDSMKGDATLFTRDDEIEQAWELLKPILDTWENGGAKVPVATYEAGSWGPEESLAMLHRHGHRWRRLQR